MKKVPENPIRTFVTNLLNSGKTTKEQICVASDLKYDTFNNIFVRPRVSMMIRKSMLFAGIIPEKVYHEYETWLRDVYKPAQKTTKTKEHYRNDASFENERDEKAIDRNP